MRTSRKRLSAALRRLRDPRGFGLIELTIALTMLAIALVSLSAVFVSGNVVFRRAGQQDAASVLADRMLERYRAAAWNDIALSSQLVSATDVNYQGDDALSGSLTNDLTETNGATTATTCTGTDQNALPLTCIPSRSIPDTSTSHPETAPDGKSYRIDSYVTWGCPDGTTPDPTTGCGGSLFVRTKVVTVVVRDASNLGASVYRSSTSFDRLSGDSMPATTNMSTSTVATTGTTAATTTSGSAPSQPDSVVLASGGGAGNAYVNSSNVTSTNVDVNVPSSSLGTDKVFLSIDDGTGLHTVNAQASGLPGGGPIHFTNLNLQLLADGPITISSYTENSAGDSQTVSTTVTKDTVAPDAPTSVALQNGTGDGSWINASTVGGVYAQVGLDANSLATDTVSVTFSDGTTTTAAATASPAGGAQAAFSVGGVDASSLADGTNNVRATAKVQDQAGNWSTGVTSTTYSKDTVITLNVSYTDKSNSTADQITGTSNAGNTLTITESVPNNRTFGPTTLASSTVSVGVETLVGGVHSQIGYSYVVKVTDTAGNQKQVTVAGQDTK